jgi:DNA-binding response OmpR family regulator
VSAAKTETVLVVEDNDALRAGLVLNLERRGYRVESAGDGSEGLRKAFDTRPDLIVLDIVLPGRTGLEIVSELRRRGRTVPVLILSARDRTEDKVEGLNLGADDYLAKPFELPELMARVDAMLRRGRADRMTEPPVTFGRVTLDRERRQVLFDGREIELSVKEFGVLDLLAEAPGRPRTREEIIDRVWGWDFQGSPRTVDNFILSLRQKLEEDPNHPRHIITVRSVGYKLVRDRSN